MKMYRSTKKVFAENLGLVVIACSAISVLWVLLRYEPVQRMSPEIRMWWTALCAVSVFNVCSWRLAARALKRRRTASHSAVYIFGRRQLLLSAVFVIGCAFRSILPRADV